MSFVDRPLRSRWWKRYGPVIAYTRIFPILLISNIGSLTSINSHQGPSVKTVYFLYKCSSLIDLARENILSQQAKRQIRLGPPSQNY
ncbi:hypothetical protein CEXT_592221 [Caerostris extrusa]|uniref:Uncharacterized protein n=1 Tax=Caerostris extrusa TaxID=172846 RepID=A0AAV4RHH4_CAEEX|nr:hypothetical protein CEXT_592221 [Caerostris extrusa]